jgi:hypothetical protein
MALAGANTWTKPPMAILYDPFVLWRWQSGWRFRQWFGRWSRSRFENFSKASLDKLHDSILHKLMPNGRPDNTLRF